MLYVVLTMPTLNKAYLFMPSESAYRGRSIIQVTLPYDIT
jgi:hypothetical protein